MHNVSSVAHVWLTRGTGSLNPLQPLRISYFCANRFLHLDVENSEALPRSTLLLPSTPTGNGRTICLVNLIGLSMAMCDIRLSLTKRTSVLFDNLGRV